MTGTGQDQGRYPRWRHAVASMLALTIAAPGGACASRGAARVVHDRFDYAEAISRSWKQQMLLNLVKLRYADAPVFLDVASVITQYAFEGQVTLSGQVADGNASNIFGIGGAGRWADRPTITYQPLTGQRFTRSLLTPIAPASVIALVQAGWPVDVVFRICVRTANGVRAGARGRLLAQEEDPRFQPLLDAMRRLQSRSAIGLRVERRGETEVAVVVISPIDDEQTRADRRLVTETLGLDPNAREYDLVFGALNQTNRELALLTRSMLEVFTEMAFGIDVPAEHGADGRVGPMLPPQPPHAPAFHVATGADRPADAFVAVFYHGHWFWIADRDFASKRSLSFLLLLLALAETGPGAAAPALTIGTGS